MSLSETVSQDRKNNSHAAGTAAKPVQPSTQAEILKDTFNRLGKSRPHLGVLGSVAAGIGAALSVGCTIWAIQLDVPVPMALMVGYCTLVGSACLAATPSPAQELVQSAAPVSARPSPSYAAWKLVNKFSISDASRLWCDIEPGCPVTQESIAWARALQDAISRGELPMVEKAGTRKELIERERENPSWHTEVTRDALRSWATSHGYNPRFLND